MVTVHHLHLVWRVLSSLLLIFVSLFLYTNSCLCQRGALRIDMFKKMFCFFFYFCLISDLWLFNYLDLSFKETLIKSPCSWTPCSIWLSEHGLSFLIHLTFPPELKNNTWWMKEIMSSSYIQNHLLCYWTQKPLAKVGLTWSLIKKISVLLDPFICYSSFFSIPLHHLWLISSI